jgi:glycerophosphodiester phosphodiesterase
MKFGKTFLFHQIPEWSIFYMNYKHLKKIIKSFDHVWETTQDHESIADLVSQIMATFFFELDRDIEKVNEFYNNKNAEYQRRLQKLIHVLGYTDSASFINHQIESNDELDEIISILLELRSIFRSLKWFGELNHKGFIKILKKLDKKLTFIIKDEETHGSTDNSHKFSFELSNNNKENYLSTRVNALPFANEVELLNSLDIITKILDTLGEDANNVIEDTSKSIETSFDFLKIGTRRRYSFDQDFLETYYALINQDLAVPLKDQLRDISSHNKLTMKFLLSLLNKSTLVNSTKCIDVLFDALNDFVTANPGKLESEQNNSLYDASDISGRNFFHQHIISLGKKQLLAVTTEKVTPGEPIDVTRFIGNGSGPDGGNLVTGASISGFSYILKKLDNSTTSLRNVLIAKDNYMRTPVHYASQYGLKDVTKIIFQYLHSWKLIDPTISIDSIEVWGDQEGLTPLHLAIVGKHPKTTENLIMANRNLTLECPSLLLLAVRLNSADILNSLILQGEIDIDYTDLEHNNETALYIASKFNYHNLVEFLLEKGASTELGENVFGWTPVFIAASEGFQQIVKILIEFHCRFDIVDDSGWLPMEHACLRGHLTVADLLCPKDKDLLLYDVYHPENNLSRLPSSSSGSVVTSPALKATDSNLISTSSIDRLPETSRNAVNEVFKQLKSNESLSPVLSRSKSPIGRQRMKRAKPIKSFGHRYLNEDESLILITLGTTDLRDLSKAVELNKISLSKTFSTELDTALSISITCREIATNNPVEPPVLIDLPLEDQHGSATDPITFKLANNLSSEDIIVTFDLIPTYQYSSSKKKKILGRATALLKDAYTRVGPNLRSLNNKITLPIIESVSLDILGSLRFEYLCVKSFSHKAMSIGRSDTYWKQLVSTRVIGHRGLGKNINGKKSLQLGENTVESFIAAASLGASYVEFDVQLTKDYVAVVYHDFTVAESGVDIPMHALTAEQFLSLNDDQKNKEMDRHRQTDNAGTPYSLDDVVMHKMNRAKSISSFPSAPNFRPNDHSKFSASLTPTEEADDEVDREYRDQISSRMKLTKTWKDKGFKGNARGLSVASNFVTLKELFKKIPKNVGFNIELKYPMLDEAETESMGEIAIDMNFYVDTILKVVYDENANGRDILFSSFHPDICLLLSLKQPSIPILFLTESGAEFMADIRASSLQNAIRFAKKWNLLGIVSAAIALVKTPRLAQVVKTSGLVCVTYGVENNEPELAKIQMKAGVDAVIADSVLAVREGLRKHEESVKDIEDSASD